ncbi:DNA binding protein [Streptomyces phage BroPlease]|nr:DNA binding protein [Streptomyces phage BroPlease]USH44965.1 DNA binding protein [Streptomyces phage GreenWeasel]
MGNYQRADVEHVLPYLFDIEAAYGIKAEVYVEDGMPKGYSDPSKGNSVYASLADARRAWRLAELTERERQSIFLRYVFDEAQEVIAAYLGVRRQTVAYYLERGVGKLTAWLNGETYVDGYDSLPEPVAA